MNEELKTIIFVGRSGSGKGTQINLLKNFIEQKNNREVKLITMGEIFRNFFREDGYAQEIAKDLSVRQGKFQPDFIADALFISDVLKIVDKDSVMFFDGYPRNTHQLQLLKEFLIYLGREKSILINLDVGRQIVKERLLLRGRGDDHEEAIESRLNEYDKFVFPMILEAKEDNYFKYLEINGNEKVEDVHKNILENLGFN